MRKLLAALLALVQLIFPYTPLTEGATYTLRVWEVDWPVRWRGRYEFTEFTQNFVDQFKSRYPRLAVQVDFRLVPLYEFETTLLRSLAQGNLPDVIAGPWSEVLLISGATVPLQRFVPPWERALFNPAAAKAVSAWGVIHAVPRWVDVRCAVVNPELLAAHGLSVEAISRFGWSLEQFAALGNAALLDTSDSGTLLDLVWASGMVLSGSVPPVTALEQLFQVVSGIAPKSLGTGFLQRFWDGNAAVIVPVGRGFVKHALERSSLAKEGGLQRTALKWRLVPLPVLPHDPGSPAVVPGRLDAVAVVSTGGKSPDQLRLACEFAVEYARATAWIASEIKALPATAADLPAWHLMTGLDEEQWRFFMECWHNLSIESAPANATPQFLGIVSGLKGPDALALLRGELSPRQCVERLFWPWYP